MINGEIVKLSMALIMDYACGQ